MLKIFPLRVNTIKMVTNKPKIVFVLNAVSITRCQKRVQEFIDQGYEVDVYGFERGNETYTKPSNYIIETIGYHTVSMNYYKRLLVITKALKMLHKKYKKEKDVIFYYFFFDVAFAASLMSNRTYIYEESDIPYANIGFTPLRKFLAWMDRRIIRHSLLTVMTSEGFINYHGLEQQRDNIFIVPNRVNPDLLNLPYRHKQLDMSPLSIGFVGGFRYQSIFNFASVVAKEYPQICFHIFGNILENEKDIKELGDKNKNIILHGVFRNPQDLPSVYEQLDLVLATYDVTSINAQYAEPNKMYESIFFRVPIIVSKGTFLSDKVNSLGIGYAINGLDVNEIRSFLDQLTKKSIESKYMKINEIPQNEAVNENSVLFEYLRKI